jgi:hypothetical protein
MNPRLGGGAATILTPGQTRSQIFILGTLTAFGPLFIYIGSLSLIGANSLALDQFPQVAGSVSALTRGYRLPSVFCVPGRSVFSMTAAPWPWPA